MSFTVGTNFGLLVQRGLIANHSGINKFGRNIEIDAGVVADVWDGGYTVASGGVSLIWVAPTQARTHTIASTDANDTSGGTGARTVKIFGLTAWDTSEVTEIVTMNTGSPPVTANSYVIIYRMWVMTKGSSGVNLGIITATAATDGTITAQIRIGTGNGIGETEMAIYGVPSNENLYIGRFYANVNKAGGVSGLVDVSLLINLEPDVELTNFNTRHTFGLQTVGTSAFTIPFDLVPKKIEGPAIVKVQIFSGTNNQDISAGFDGIRIVE